jgi:hypothetical protein
MMYIVPEDQTPRRSLRGYIAWAATGLIAAVTLAHALRSGSGWGGAAGGMFMFVLYAFLPRIEAASARRRKKDEGSVTVDDWGVTRLAGKVREAVAWDEVAWVRIYTTAAGPGAEDAFFALGTGNNKGCLVPNGLAVSSHLLAALQQRLPGLDNLAVALAMGSTTAAVFTIWTRPSGPAKAAADEPAPS